MNILKNEKNGFDFEYKDYCFSYSLKPVETPEKAAVTAKKEEKAEDKPAVAKATENAAESTESNENGFNGLNAWQEALKLEKPVTERNYPPLPDFEKQAEQLFELMQS